MLDLQKLVVANAATALLEDCWPAVLPERQLPPTDRQLRWFDRLLRRDAVACALGERERSVLRDSTLAVERRVPILSSDGAPMPIAHRLYIALEIAKLLFARPKTTLEVLRSVVVYADGGQLLKHEDEVGLAQVRGRNSRVPRLIERLQQIEACWDRLEPHVVQLGKRKGADRWRARSVTALRKQLRYWIERFRTDIGAGEAAQTIAFAEELERALPELLREIATSFAAVTAEMETTFAAAATKITEHANEIAGTRDVLTRDNEASIHISWLSQMMTRRLPGMNVLVHELAHVLDFETGGLDGYAEPCDGSDRTQRWAAAYERALAGELDVIREYGRANRSEFFAVCTEHYFTHASSLRTRAPELFELLEATYGYVPADRARPSELATLWTLIGSKLRLFW